MAYIIKIKNDKNKILYLPKGYGHDIHELTEEKEKAWKFEKTTKTLLKACLIKLSKSPLHTRAANISPLISIKCTRFFSFL